METVSLRYDLEFLGDGGEAGEIIRSYDWSQNPLGEPQAWPQPLKTLVSVMLNSHQPMFAVWGSEHIMLYNNPYGVICGKRHPAIGKRFEDVWADILADVGPILERAYDGVSTRMDDLTLTMNRNGYAEETHFAFSYTPVRDEAGSIAGMFCACTETTQQVKAKNRLLQEKQKLLNLFQQSTGFLAILAGPDHEFEFVNPGFLELAGNRDLIGKTVRQAFPELAGQGYFELLDNGFQTGEAFTARASAVTLTSHPAEPSQTRFVDFVSQPMRDNNGIVNGLFIEGHDVTDRVHAEQKQKILLQELNHRVKNLFSIAASIVALSAKSAKTPQEMAHSLSGRLGSLARAHDLIHAGFDGVSAEQTPARLDMLIRTILSPYFDENQPEGREYTGQEHIIIEGPPVLISGANITALALVFHEMATNAAKYGSLSQTGGHLHIRWSKDEDRQLRLTWSETGGPGIEAPPRSSGFGSRLAQSSIGGLSGAILHDWRPEGLRVTITVPLAGFGPSNS